MEAFTITVAKDGGFFEHPQSDMRNVGLVCYHVHKILWGMTNEQ